MPSFAMSRSPVLLKLCTKDFSSRITQMMQYLFVSFILASCDLSFDLQ